MLTLDVAMEVGSKLRYRDEQQAKMDKGFAVSAVEFRNKYLSELDNPESWTDTKLFIILDFKDVTHLAPSFAYEAFAYFRRYATPKRILTKIKFINIREVQLNVIELELNLPEYE
jgi:hypothetical protein